MVGSAKWFFIFFFVGMLSCTHSVVRKTASEGIIDKIVKAECPTCDVGIPQCTKQNTENAAENFKCITTKAGIFRRIRHPNFGMAWRMQNGLIWSDIVIDNKNNHDFSQDEGRAICTHLNAKLPSREDYMSAEDAGFLDVFNHFGPGDTHWTSSMGENSNFFGIAVSSSVDATGYGDEGYGGLLFFKEQKKNIFWDVTFKIRCVDDSNSIK